MTAPARPSPLNRLLRTRQVRRLVFSRYGRRLHLSSLFGPRYRRIDNREVAAAARARAEAVNAKKAHTAASTRRPVMSLFDTGAPSSITTRFIVLSEARSGTTLLVSELQRRWPEIRAGWEEFSAPQRARFDSFEDVVRYTFCEAQEETIVGCKIFSDQISDEELSALLQLDGMRVIILRRRNQLRRFVSLRIATKTGQWLENRLGIGVTEFPLEGRKIQIDPAHFIGEITSSNLAFDRFERLTEGLPRLEVTYEQLSDDLDGELRRVATFLGAGEPVHEAPPVLTRQNPEPLRSLIENFEEFSEFLHDVELSEFLTIGEEQEPAEGTSRVDPSFGDGKPWWPDESQRLMLRALIGPEEFFGQNWRSSLAAHSKWMEVRQVDRLYPAIHQRIRRTNLSPSTLFDYQAESMRNTARKVRLLDALQEATAALAAEDVEVTLLGSTALLAMSPDTGCPTFRTLSMSCLDLLPESEDFASVGDILRSLGWSGVVLDPSDPAMTLQRHGLTLRLHRSMLRAPATDELVTDLRVGRIAAEDLGATTMMLAPAELLVSIIADSVQSENLGSVEWILDAYRLLADTGENLDRNRLRSLARSHDLQVPVDATLELLEALTDELEPPEVITAARRHDPSASARAVTPSEITTRFIILSEQRSGSTLMVQELGWRWPEIRSQGELFVSRGKVGADSFEKLVERAFLEQSGHRIVGCKLFLDQVSPEEMASLLTLEGMRIVVLQRRNLLRRFVSLQIAKQTDTWVQNDAGTPENRLSINERRLKIDTDELDRSLQQSFTGFLRRNRLISRLPSIHVWYEDLATDLDGELRRVASFLGGGEPVHESPPRLTRQNPEPLSELILNFDEVSAHIQNIGLAEFLSEEDHRTAPTAMGDRTHDERVSSWPTRIQQELLGAVLGPQESFDRRLAEWMNLTDAWTRVETIDLATPALHPRLRTSMLPAASVLDLRSESARHTALKVRLLEALNEITATTNAAGVDLVVLGSTALASRMNERTSVGFGSLSMSGLDVTTSAEQFDALLTHLQALGWTARPSRPVASTTLRRNDLVLRLHCSLLRAATTDRLDDDLRTGLVPTSAQGGTTFIPAPAELLLSILIDGLLARPAGSIDWVIDAHRLIVDSDSLDWPRFADLATRHDLSAPVRAAIELLATLDEGLLSAETLALIHGIPITDRQRAAFNEMMRTP